MHVTFKPFVAGVVAVAFTAFLGAQQAGAQQTEGQAPSQSQAVTTAQGELLKVDSTARTLTVKTATSEMVFQYNDRTKITGAQSGAAGLGTMAGSQVTVQYQKDGRENIATSIEVRAAQPPPASPAPR